MASDVGGDDDPVGQIPSGARNNDAASRSCSARRLPASECVINPIAPGIAGAGGQSMPQTAWKRPAASAILHRIDMPATAIC
jgi:hypothetical protein